MKDTVSCLLPAFLGASLFFNVSHRALAQANVLPGWRAERKGANTVYTPTDLKAGESFALLTEPPIQLDGKDLGEWLTTQIEADISTFGTPISRAQPKSTRNKDLEIVTSGIVLPRKAERGPVMITYTVVRNGNGEARLNRIITTPNKETSRRYLPAVVKGILALSGGAGETAPVASNPATAKPKPRVRHGSDAYTRPGAGPKATTVYGIYSLMMARTGVGGMLLMVPVPVVVLKDGTYFEDFDVPLADLDLVAARRERPTAWGKWRKQGTTMQKQNSKGVWEKADFYGPLIGAKPGEKLTGLYSNLSGGGNTAFGGGVMVAVSSDITFLPDGRFKAGRFVGASSSDSSTDVQTTVRSQNDTDGTYSLNGYTLTLKYRDGRIERKAFAFMDNDGTRDAIYLDGSGYLKKDNGK